MLMVETKLNVSDIEGIGLFANQFIRKGTIIWKYDKRTTISWTDTELQSIKAGLSSISYSNIERFLYMRNGVWMLNIDDSRFMNHSFTPNMGYSEYDACYALRDIQCGEELTYDYNTCSEETPENYMRR